MDNPLVELQRLGQSPWHDNIHRGLLASGALATMVRDGDITGLTSNPTIFEQAIAKTAHYDEALAPLVTSGRKPEQIVDALVVEDIRAAAEVFLPVFQRSGRTDGFVSIEVAPDLAHDTGATVREAKRLWRAVNRPNLMVKIPATRAGIPAIAECIAAGINVNVTLIFALDRYDEVMRAYLDGLERRQEAGMRLDRIASVASFFVSRVDTLVDRLLEPRIAAAPAEQRTALERLRGKAAIAQAKLAYGRFRDLFGSDRFLRLARDGAHVQRPLWASTSAKNPAYPDVYYIEALVGPDTVNTMPPQTLAAYKDHGHPERRIDAATERANQVLAELRNAGIDMDAVTAQLETEGVAAFVASWNALRDVVATRREALRQGARTQMVLGGAARAVQRALGTLAGEGVAERLWRRDVALWPGQHPRGSAALRWLEQADAAPAVADTASALADGLRREGVSHVVVCGSPALTAPAAAIRKAFGVARGGCELTVLTSLDGAGIQAALRRTDPARTAWVLAGGDAALAEAVLDVVQPHLATALGDEARRRLVVLARHDSPLGRLAYARDVRAVLDAPEDEDAHWWPLGIGGLLPLAILGHELGRYLERAGCMAMALGAAVPEAHNPGIQLGAVLGALAVAGRDKLTLAVPDRLAGFAAWLEQLLGRTTVGPEHAIVPITGEPAGPPAVYGKDRMFVQVRLGSGTDRAMTALARAGHPVITIRLTDAYDLGGEMLRWAVAAAIAGRAVGADPFDAREPSELDAQAVRLAQRLAAGEDVPDVPALVFSSPDFQSRLGSHLAAARGRRWVAVVSLVGPTPSRHAAVASLRAAVRKRFGVATVASWGAPATTSLGRLLTMGPSGAIPIVLAPERTERGDVLARLDAARALAVAAALGERRRPVVSVALERQVEPGLAAMLGAVQRRASVAAPRKRSRTRTSPPSRARAAGRR